MNYWLSTLVLRNLPLSKPRNRLVSVLRPSNYEINIFQWLSHNRLLKMTYRITRLIYNQLVIWFRGNQKIIYYQGAEKISVNCYIAFLIVSFFVYASLP